MNSDYWFAIPLIIAVSLVYAATRHERMQPILVHAAKFGGWAIAFMLTVFVVLYLVALQV
jgi:hypothetical protein